MNNEKLKKNPLEWTVFAFSVLLIGSVLVYLITEMICYSPSPPELSVTIDATPQPGQPYLHKIIILNRGKETAKNVRVSLRLKNNGKLMDSGQLEFPYLPGCSQKTGWVNFSQRPHKAASIIAHITGYQKP